MVTIEGLLFDSPRGTVIISNHSGVGNNRSITPIRTINSRGVMVGVTFIAIQMAEELVWAAVTWAAAVGAASTSVEERAKAASTEAVVTAATTAAEAAGGEEVVLPLGRLAQGLTAEAAAATPAASPAAAAAAARFSVQQRRRRQRRRRRRLPLPALEAVHQPTIATATTPPEKVGFVL